ncbi:MAG: hypothetical protein V3W32_10715 [Gemmatimonadota bacterium]
MPSDGRIKLALESVQRWREAFHSAVAVTVDQVRSFLEARQPPEGSASDHVATELGPFAAGRIDAKRFSSLVSEPDSEDVVQLAPLERALAALRTVSQRGDDLFTVRMERGEILSDRVARALAEAGRAFGAARVIRLARSDRYEPEQHAALLDSFPFQRWSTSEREIAPPLVVEVDGADLLVAGLADFLDGSQKLVLVVRDASPPAALVRLITPGVLVLQTADPADLDRLSRTPGPAVAALVSEEAAHFLHEPATNGRAPLLEVTRMPEEEPRRALGSISAFQQTEELRHLAALASRPTAAAAGAAAAGAAPGIGAPAAAAAQDGTAPMDPANKLAAWLLSQADLSDLESAAG